MTIDIIRFARVPNLSLKQMLQLARTLLRDKPQDSNKTIDEAAAALAAHIEVVEQALTRRLVATNAELLASQVDFDRALDGLWVALRRLLELFEAFEHPGLAALSEVQQIEADLDELQADAARARELRDRLFGDQGTTFTSTPYPEQAETMATILRLIDHQGLLPEIEALVGPRLPRLLKVCQRRYEDMVSERLTRDRSLADNLREARQQLRWLIMQYNTAVFGLAKYGDSASYELVERALRAVTHIRPSAGNATNELEAELELLEGELEAELEDGDSPEDSEDQGSQASA